MAGRSQRIILSYDYSRISGYELHQRPRKGQILILSYGYAQNVRVQRTKQGQWIILSYDYSRISGYEVSENTTITILSYDHAQNVRVQQTRQGQRMILSYDYSRTFRAPFQQYFQSAIPTVLSERHSNSTCRSPFQQYFQSAIPTALAGRHSNSTFRAPFQEPSNTTHSKAFKQPLQLHGLSAFRCNLIMLCSGCSRVRFFVIFGTGYDRVRFSFVVGTIWLQYGPSGCSRDDFRPQMDTKNVRILTIETPQP